MTLINIVIKLQSEMDETKAQLRIITKILQDIMSKLQSNHIFITFFIILH